MKSVRLEVKSSLQIRLQNSRFFLIRKARSAVSVILACEAREPHTPVSTHSPDFSFEH